MSFWKNNISDSKVAQHFTEMGHSGSLNNLNLLHLSNKGKKLNLLEVYEIQNSVIKCALLLNDQQDFLIYLV